MSSLFDGRRGGSIIDAWDSIEAAPENDPLPSGKYVCLAKAGELITARTTGTPGYRIRFVVLEGEYAGRVLWHTCWLSQDALPMSKRDLSKLGITGKEQLELSLPQAFRCNVTVTLRQEDDGTEYNRVRRFDVVGIEPDPTRDPDFPIDGEEGNEGGTDEPIL